MSRTLQDIKDDVDAIIRGSTPTSYFFAAHSIRALAEHIERLEGRLDALTEQPALATADNDAGRPPQPGEERESVAPATAPKPDPRDLLPSRDQMVRIACVALNPGGSCKRKGPCEHGCGAKRAVDAILGMIARGAK